jgi:hypothetical protein
MKTTFAAYYRPTDADFESLWKDATFSVDANVLLNAYRYTETTRTRLLDILSRLGSRLWLPHQVGLEYQRNRLNVISGQLPEYDVISKKMQEFSEQFDRDHTRTNRHCKCAWDLVEGKVAPS